MGILPEKNFFSIRKIVALILKGPYSLFMKKFFFVNQLFTNPIAIYNIMPFNFFSLIWDATFFVKEVSLFLFIYWFPCEIEVPWTFLEIKNSEINVMINKNDLIIP